MYQYISILVDIGTKVRDTLLEHHPLAVTLSSRLLYKVPAFKYEEKTLQLLIYGSTVR